jgi:hypothetical protein
MNAVNGMDGMGRYLTATGRFGKRMAFMNLWLVWHCFCSAQRTLMTMNLVLFRLLALFLLLAPMGVPPALRAATFTVSPSVIGNDYDGVLSLQVGGLTNGEPVLVQRFYDFNGNGTPEGDELLLQSFRLKDGEAFVVAGVTNLHMPGDLGGTAGAISAQMHMKVAGFQQKFIGKHVYRLSSPYNRFAAQLVPITVTNSAYPTTLSGSVTSGATPVANASVVAFIASGDGMEPRIGAATDGTGHYSMKLPAGVYMLLAFKPGYVCEFSASPIVALGPGANISTNLSLLAGTRTISGRIADAANSQVGLGGLLMPCESQDGRLGVTFTDASGNFTASVTPGYWRVGSDDGGAEFLGYVNLENSAQVNTTAGDVAGVNILLPRATALFTGYVKTEANQPLAGVPVYGHDQQWTYFAGDHTDLNGRYFIGVTSGMWDAEVDNWSTEFANYVFSHPEGTVNIQAGQVITRNFIGRAAPYTISGYVKTATGSPVANLDVYGWAVLGSENYNIGARTDDQGFYSMNVASGQWNIAPACEGDDGLMVRGFRCIANKAVTVSSANATQDFTVQLCTGVQITTVNLPDGKVATPYEIQLQAEGCGQFLNWSLSPGSAQLPPGLNLISNSGLITGNPSQAGTYNFSVRVDDGLGSADRQLSLTIATDIPLGIYMQLLPDATNGVVYAIQLQAQGGRPPYSWSLAPGSGPVPPGLSLGSNGTISGTPTTLGEFYFYVQVTDTAPTTVESSGPFLIIVRPPPPPPLSITTTSLPGATVGQGYSAQLQASGGYPPYLWGLAVGSANLPDGLTMNGNTGEISGTPRAAGTYSFRVSLNDQAFVQVTRVLTINVQTGTPVLPALVSPTRTPDGKFTFLINGTQGTSYIIQSSADLQSWNPLRTINAPSGSFLFVDDSPLPGTRYYRILVGQ